MKNRKVHQLIRLLDPKERSRFEKWLKIELNGKQPKTLALYQLLRRGAEIEEIWPQLYPERPLPERPFYDSGFRRLEHQLSDVLEKYFALQAFDRDPDGRDLYLIKELNQRNASQLFTHKLRKVEARLEEAPLRDETHYQQRYRLEREHLHFLLKYNRREVAQAFRRLNERFEAWWMHEKLRMALNTLNFREVFNEDSPSLLIEGVMQAAQETPYLRSLPVLDLYRRLYLLLQDREAPGDLFASISRQADQLGPDVLTDAFTLLLNYYTRKSNEAGETRYLEQLFAIYEWGVREGLLLTDHILPWKHYKNLVTVGLRLGRHDQVWTYLHDLRDLLLPEEQEEAFQFNLARYYLATQAPDQARRILARKFSNVFYEVSGRLALIKLRYEEGEREDLGNELRALRTFTDRQPRLGSLNKASIINELRLIEKLTRAYDPDARARLREEIAATEPLGNREWLEAQIG